MMDKREHWIKITAGEICADMRPNVASVVEQRLRDAMAFADATRGAGDVLSDIELEHAKEAVAYVANMRGTKHYMATAINALLVNYLQCITPPPATRMTTEGFHVGGSHEQDL